MNPKQLATMSDHVATIRELADDVNSTIKSSDWHDVEGQLCEIKVQCHILREHLKDMMPFLTDEVIT